MPNDPKNEWLNVVAHDLKTPINSVRGCIELVQQLGPLNERQQHFAERAMVGLQRMEHLVARLLDISWVDADAPLDLISIDLPAVIYEAVDMLKDTAAQRSINIQMEMNKDVQQVVADPRRLVQVLDNLISNAIKYNRPQGQVIIRAAIEGDNVRVSVADTGIGIAPDDQANVFERFFRAPQTVRMKIEGSGLGLAITRGIVQKHRGRIWLESALGEGSTFFFTLPLLQGTNSDGNDDFDETSQNLGEGREGRISPVTNLASEERDVVNDNIQENREFNRVDSSSGDEY